MTDLIENKNFLTEEELEEIKVLETDEFPWYLSESGPDNPEFIFSGEKDKEFFAHSIIKRYEKDELPTINSDYYDLFNNIFIRFCKKNGIKYKRILRMCLNFTYHFDSEFYGFAHVDHEFPHNIVLMYLNDADGNTVFFDKMYDPNSNDLCGIETKNLKIKKEVKPELGKVVSFNGLNYHGLRPCKINTHRIVCVVTFN